MKNRTIRTMFLAVMILCAMAGRLRAGKDAISGKLSYDYPTDAILQQVNDQIYSPLSFAQADAGVPEIRIIERKEEDIEYVGDKKDLIETRFWQESPSRIIYHNGKYHTWIMHIEKYIGIHGWDFKNYYLTSDDGYRWNVEGEFPVGERGQFDDFRREGLQVLKFGGKFWMFYASAGRKRPVYDFKLNGIGLLVADSPAGPWEYAVDGPIIKTSIDPTKWDCDGTNNPYPVYFKGKWYVYYKSSNNPQTGSKTRQGVAISDSITGPYVKYENNPIFDGHGSFAWVYRGGIAVLPFSSQVIHWSPDGIHFYNVYTPDGPGAPKVPMLSAFYLPHDPLCGEPVTDQEPDEIWGLETRSFPMPKKGEPRDWNIIRSTVKFNPVKRGK